MSQTITDPGVIALNACVEAIERMDEPYHRWVVAAMLAIRYGVTDKATSIEPAGRISAEERAKALWDTPLGEP